MATTNDTKTNATETATAPRKGEHISATIPKDLFDRLSDIRFEKRHDRLSDTVRAAVQKYVDSESGAK